ncbi:Heparanase [Folsomia candida]|uniref:Heparanase n=1 Tax=Folsomia candida TaxID=158441 RepID=A0A226E242_FOLCA|nr:Heparanase [Folsomia candida]
MKYLRTGVLFVTFFVLCSQTSVTVKKAPPAFESIGVVLEEASGDLKKKGDGRKLIEMKEDMEKRLREIWPLEEALWKRARQFKARTNSSSPSPRVSSPSSPRPRRVTKRRRFCVVRFPVQ